MIIDFYNPIALIVLIVMVSVFLCSVGAWGLWYLISTFLK